MIKIAYINIYGQSGLTNRKLLELDNFIQKHCLQIVCLQETYVSDNTFDECSYIYKNFQVISNNNTSGYGTCTLVKKDFNVTNIIKDVDGRIICLDIDEKLTVVNLYLPSGTDQQSKLKRESVVDNLPNLLLYKKETGVIGGDLNSITEKKDSLLHPDQKMSKCFRKLIKLYNLSDAFRELYPNEKQFSRYYTWKGAAGATRIDRCYFWGDLKTEEAKYCAISFSDHLAHIVNFGIKNEPNLKDSPRKRSIYKIKHWLVKDAIFREMIRSKFDCWLDMKEYFSPVYLWEEVIKPGIKKIAIAREKQINKERKQELEALQLKLDFHLSNLKDSNDQSYSDHLTSYELAKKNLHDFYQKRAKIILYQNRAEIFEMSDTTKIYHFESLSKYIKQTNFNKIEINNQIYDKKEDIEGAINGALEISMSKSHSVDLTSFQQLFSFDVPKINEKDNEVLTQSITKSELKKSLRKLRSKASPGIDSIPSSLYVKMFDLFAPLMVEVFNDIIHGQSPPASMRTSIVQFLNKPKKARSIKLSDKRKISVLCTDYKCLEKIMANRLKSVMSKFISPSQFAIKPKKIHQAISTARDLINFVKKKNISMGFLSLDMEAAFDNLSMDYVYKCFDKYGFSSSAINIFRNIYADSMALSYINGSMSKVIMDLSGNLRQGGCCSMELFVVGVNPLLQLLEKKLKGVTLYKLPMQGPVKENEAALPQLVKTGKVVGFVDDACPVVTTVGEFSTVDDCLKLFESASGCKFHRNPSTQKCKVTLFGSWKHKFNQDNIPLKFLQVTDHLDILGVRLYENWRSTQKENGLKVVQKISIVADRWKSGRFYEFLLRPHIVNTYMFSNIWYTAGVIDLQLGHLDEAQKRGNHYVHADCFLKPENMANYLPKNKMGLGIVHVLTKALALFIKNLLSEAKSDVNCYMSAVVEHYCCNVNLEPIPVRPPYLTDKLIQLMNLVLRQCDRLETKNIFHLLLKYEFKLDEDWKLRVVPNNPNLNFDNAVHLINSKILTITVRGSLWKHFHDVHYDDILRGKIKNSVPVCKLCNDVDIN